MTEQLNLDNIPLSPNLVIVEFMGYHYTFKNFDDMCHAVIRTQQGTTTKSMSLVALRVEKLT